MRSLSTVRFIGDPTGYQVDMEIVRRSRQLRMSRQQSSWVEAQIGITGKRVQINLDQAYLIELPPDA